jgi:uncharacterized damage-inducible protein DinB
MQTTDLLDRLLEHDAWTTRRVLELAQTLTDDQLDQNFDIGRRTVRETIGHMVGNIEVWTDLMAARPVRSRITDKQSMLELRQRYDAAFRVFAQLARQLRDTQRLNDTYVDVLDQPPQRKSNAGTILHVVTHDHQHRSEILHMLQRLGVREVIEGDVLSWEAAVGGWDT